MTSIKAGAGPDILTVLFSLLHPRTARKPLPPRGKKEDRRTRRVRRSLHAAATGGGRLEAPPRGPAAF
ncbi:hypothetical protein CE91St45_29560 [Oscillospiraceae bacterium]|nr:hypothetical protein CE91St45_29560 [Oscillospiraceae bacterium]